MEVEVRACRVGRSPPRPSFRPRCSSQTIRHRSSTSLVLMHHTYPMVGTASAKWVTRSRATPAQYSLLPPVWTPRLGVSPLTTTPFVSIQLKVYHPSLTRYASSRLLSDAQDGLLTTLPFRRCRLSNSLRPLSDALQPLLHLPASEKECSRSTNVSGLVLACPHIFKEDES
jgi:hypothetical protein